MEFNKELLSKPITGENLEKEVAYFEPEFLQNRCRTSLNGKWKFIFEDDFDEDFLDENFDINSLNDIKVPSNIELNGYDNPQYVNTKYPWEGKEDLTLGEVPRNNKVGVYFKDIEITSLDEDHFIEFEGFESALYLFINGKYVGYSTKNYTTSTFKINDYLKVGLNRIVVAVYKYSFISWYSDQDMWRFSGLHRSINLVKRNPFHIIDIKNNAVLQGNYKDGHVELNVELSKSDKELSLECIFRLGEKVIRKRTYKCNNKNVTINFDIIDCYPWSDETPTLYSIDLKLMHGIVQVENTSIDFGFKKVEFKDGTLMLNGQRFIIKGVNRHEFDSRYGRAVTNESIEEDLLNIKAHNINAIRTSHYPNSNYFYKRCNELGILVMDETAIETHGTWMHLDLKENQESNCLPGSLSEFKNVTVERGLTMYERDKNHTCIFSWSLGNESYAGKNLEALSNALKEKDKTRFIHYEGCVHLDLYSHITDIRSEMYIKPNNIRKYLKKHVNKPYMLCEFSHSMGNSTGNFDEYMQLAKDFPYYNGGFIWDYMDQGLYVNGSYKYGGDFNDFPHDDNFCANGLILASKQNTSKIETVKYYYQPISFDISKEGIRIDNNYNFIDTSELTFNYKFYENEDLKSEKNFKMTVFPNESLSYIYHDKFRFDKNKRYLLRVSAIDKNNHEIAFDEKFIFGEINKVNYQITKDYSNVLKVYNSLNHITVENENIQVVFNGLEINNGGLEAIRYKGKYYLNNVVFPTLFRATIDNEAILYKYFNSYYLSASKYPFYNPYFGGIKVVTKNDKKVVVVVKYRMLAGYSFNTFKIVYTIFNSGEIKVKFSYRTPLFLPKPPLVGIKFKFDKSYDNFEYIGLGKGDNYIDRYKGQKYGKYISKASKEYIPYSIPQECGNHEFVKEVKIRIDDKYLSFIALDKTFSFKYLPYDEFEVENAHRTEELPNTNFNYLTIHAINKGVGGDDSWGAPVHRKYRLKNRIYTQSFVIKIKE